MRNGDANYSHPLQDCYRSLQSVSAAATVPLPIIDACSIGGEWGVELRFEVNVTVRPVARGVGPVQPRMPFDFKRE